jgi:hypothetical protein
MEEWDAVTFETQRSGAAWRFFRPTWRPMRRQDWIQLGLEAPAI